MGTAIEWTDTVWNPVTGCSKVSEGCRNCYAFALHDMRHKAFLEGKKLPQQYAKPFSEIQLFPERLDQPLRWRKSRRIFVNSMSDLFHDQVPDEYLDQVFAVILACATIGNPEHTFQILTKRPERMLKYFTDREPFELIKAWSKAGDGWITMNDPDVYFSEYIEGLTCHDWDKDGRNSNASEYMPWGYLKGLWPLPNVWLGTSVENQKAADERIPLLLQVPAAVRFLSCEPLLGPVDLEFIAQFEHEDNEGYGVAAIKGIDWVIVGGESGTNARPIHPDWARDLRDQCQEYGVAFFFKQWGEWFPRDQWEYNPDLILPDDNAAYTDGPKTYVFDGVYGLYPTHCIGKNKAGRLLDGEEWNEFPGGERDASRT